ncbi:MAG: VOC family protein [Actinobacteria bacterium]|nr:VOC family protein [Actinomycetota bacterium]
MSFYGLDRVALVVWDMDKAISFFTQVLGVDFDVVEDQVEQIRVAHARNKFGLELMPPVSTTARLGAHVTQLLNDKGEGIDIVAVRVDDIEQAI